MTGNHKTLNEVQQELYNGNISLSQVVEYYLDNIKQINPSLNAFLEVFEKEALERAVEVQKKINTGKAGKLVGLVFGIKDIICYKNHYLSCGSNILNGFKSSFTATAVQRLLDQDAIIIGRQNCDEFAMGSSNENSAFGIVNNGIKQNYVPGGSSGGSAVAVQMEMCRASLGSDTGGSVRQPASFCGVVGLKPTYSRISRYGLTSYASSFDIIGVLSKTVEDAALVLQYTAGEDNYDSTVSRKKVPYYSLIKRRRKYKIGYIKDILESPLLNGEVKECFDKKLVQLEASGHQVFPLDFHLLDYALPTYYILTTAEASSNLARYDGVRYGHRTLNPSTLEHMYKKSRTEGFGEEVIRRILLGTFVLSAGHYDAYFSHAQKVRRLIREKTEDMMSSCDFLLSPTAPTTAFAIGENTKDPLQMYLADLYTVQASLAGMPAISIPIGKDSKGLPIGLQVMANYFEEGKLLSFADSINIIS